MRQFIPPLLSLLALPLAALATPALAQGDATGPMVSPGAAPGLDLPMIDRPDGPNRRRAQPGDSSGEPTAPILPQTSLSSCLAQATADPDAALDRADDWLKNSEGPARAAPQMCLGTAYAALEHWEPAINAFTEGRDDAAPGDHALRARLGAMAGNAALAGGSPVGALAVLEVARADAAAAKDNAGLAGIAVDRARALVLLHREGEAATALADARAAQPDDPSTWLLSATLARRMGQLADAQTDIEKAAMLAPTDGEVGLEAGVIAELSGHTDAARKSWQSVVAADPDGAAGRQASAYLAQIADPAAAGPPTPATHP